MKHIRLVIIISALFLLANPSHSQKILPVHAGPKGIFIGPLKDIPNGKSVSFYKVERSLDRQAWIKVGEMRTPGTFAQFESAVQAAKVLFPPQPVTSKSYLQMIYAKATSAPNVDSIRNLSLLYPSRMGLGILFHDTSAKKYIPYFYRIKAMSRDAKILYSLTSDSISFPPALDFDPIKRSTSGYKNGVVQVKWKSSGSNPAPLFMVMSLEDGKNVPQTGGLSSRYSVNDTSFYTFEDSVSVSSGARVFQYFLVPFDGFNNIGNTSQVATIALDNFNETNFVSPAVVPGNDSLGLNLSWKLSQLKDVRNIYIFRSEQKLKGYEKLAELKASEEKWLDKKAGAGKKYFYILQVNAQNGKRFKQSDTLEILVPGYFKSGITCKTPVMQHVSKAGKGIRLLVAGLPEEAVDVSFYRGKPGAQPTLLKTQSSKGASALEYTDTSTPAADYKDSYFSASYKCPVDGKLLSSAQKPAETGSTDEITFFEAYPHPYGTMLYWDDALASSKKYAYYQLAGHNGGPNSRSPLMVLSEKQTASSYLDTSLSYGNEFTYILKMVDKSGRVSEKSWQVTVRKEK